MFKEALKNAARYAACSEVKVIVEDAEDAWILPIQDNRCGLDTEMVE